MIAEARMGIAPSEIIQNPSQEIIRSVTFSEEKSQKISDANHELNHLERQNSAGNSYMCINIHVEKFYFKYLSKCKGH